MWSADSNLADSSIPAVGALAPVVRKRKGELLLVHVRAAAARLRATLMSGVATARNNLKSGLRNLYRFRKCIPQSFLRQASAEASSMSAIDPTLAFRRFMILRTTALRRQGDGFRRYLQQFGRKSVSRRNLFSSLSIRSTGFR